MAVVADQVIVELIAKVDRYNANMDRASTKFNRAMSGIERRAQASGRAISAAFGGIGVAFAARGAQQLIDASTRIRNSLKIAGLAGEELAAVYDDLFASAQRNAAPINALATLYSRAAAAQKELGATSEDLASFTDNVAKALRVQGTSAIEAQGALLQLGQALGSGRVMAEEFNSINEGARPILQAAAAGIDEAAGSVAKLKQLVIDGRVSNRAFFDGIQAGAYVLDNQLVNAEITVSQAFVRLQNVLIDAAGRFNETSGAGQRFVTFLGVLGDKITEISESEGFEWALNALGDEIQRTFDDGQREIQQIIGVVDGLKASFDRFGPSVSDADLALAEAEQSLANFASHTVGKMGEVDAAAQDLFQQILEGKGSAELAAQAIEALGDANPDFRGLLNEIGGVIQKIYELRGAAIAAARPDVSGLPPTYAGQEGAPPPATGSTTPPITLVDYPVIGGGKGGSKQSPEEKFKDALQRVKDQTAALGLEREALGKTTIEIEKARVAQELLNDARDAGITITPEVTASIEATAEAYAEAADSLERATKLQEAFVSIAESSLTTFIQDLRAGKSAAEALSNVFDNIANQLIQMAVQGLVQAAFGGLFGGGGGGLFGGLFGGFRAHGGSVQQGKGYMVGERGPEPFFPTTSGRILPNSALQDVGGGGGEVVVYIQSGEMFDATVQTISGRVASRVVSSGIASYDRNLSSRMVEQNARGN